MLLVQRGQQKQCLTIRIHMHTSYQNHKIILTIVLVLKERPDACNGISNHGILSQMTLIQTKYHESPICSRQKTGRQWKKSSLRVAMLHKQYSVP